MFLSIYLSNTVKDILTCYGNLDYVVNEILKAGSNGLISIMDKPKAPEKKDGTYYNINILDEDYIELIKIYGTKSPRISLRRLLYWFVDNEMYAELGWEGKQEYKDSNDEKALALLSDIKLCLYKLEKLTTNCDKHISNIRNELNTMEDKIWYA